MDNYGRRCNSLRNLHPTGERLTSCKPFPICVHGRLSAVQLPFLGSWIRADGRVRRLACAAVPLEREGGFVGSLPGRFSERGSATRSTLESQHRSNCLTAFLVSGCCRSQTRAPLWLRLRRAALYRGLPTRWPLEFPSVLRLPIGHRVG